MRPCRIAYSFVLPFLLTTSVAQAHPSYEYTVAILADGEGREFVVSKRYDDGIFATDPVTLVMRTTGGEVVRETRHGRDMVILGADTSAPLAFRYDGLFPVLPVEILRVEAGTLSARNHWGLFGLGIVLPYWEHWLGYLISGGLINVVCMVLWRAGTLEGKEHVGEIFMAYSFAVLFLLGCLYYVVVLSYLSLPLLVPVVFGMFVGWFPYRRPLFQGWDEPIGSV